MNVLRYKLFMLFASAMPICALAATGVARSSGADVLDGPSSAASVAPMPIWSGPAMTIPLRSWPVDVQSFVAQHRATAKGSLKAATDRATVYRPVPVCRLIDTRGNPAFFTLAGPLAPGSTNIPAAGRCGIPSTGVAGISLSFHVLNLTVNNGGFIAFLQQGAPVNGTNAVFNPGAMWTAATANVSIPNDSGNFAIFIAQSTVHVIVDVNGYYQDMDFVDVGTQELDISGNVDGGDVFEALNTGTGSALAGTNFGTGPALRIGGGSFAVAGAGIGSGTTAFIFEVDTAAFGSGGNLCGGVPSIAVIDHPMLNGDPNAMVLITARENAPSSLGPAFPAPSASGGAVSAFYLSGGICSAAAATNHWAVRDKSGEALVNVSQYSVFIIKAQ